MEKYFRILPILLILALGVAWLFPLAALGTHFGLWHFRTAFALLAGAAITDAVLLALSGVAMILAIAVHNEKAKHRSILLAVIVLIPMGFVFYFGARAGQVPQIHDISTDREVPPRFSAVLAQRPADANPLDYNSDVAAAQAGAYPFIQPLLSKLAPAEALQKAQDVARAMGWTLVAVDTGKGTLEATDTTFWFGFTDDIVVRVRAADGGSRIDVRSASRVGRSDIGKNAGRIKAFLDRMQAL